jgi:hypothetical protein
METNITQWDNAEDINAVTLPAYDKVWVIKPTGKKKKKWTELELQYIDYAEDPHEINDLPNTGSDFTREELLELWKKKKINCITSKRGRSY